LLNQEKTQLTADKEDLTSQLDALRADYNTCSASLQDTKDDLDACEAVP